MWRYISCLLCQKVLFARLQQFKLSQHKCKQRTKLAENDGKTLCFLSRSLLLLCYRLTFDFQFYHMLGSFHCTCSNIISCSSISSINIIYTSAVDHLLCSWCVGRDINRKKKQGETESRGREEGAQQLSMTAKQQQENIFFNKKLFVCYLKPVFKSSLM